LLHSIFQLLLCFFFSSRRRHTRSYGDWSSDVCSSDLGIRYFEPLDTNNSYAAGWGEILSLSAIGDYILGTLSNAGMSSNVGYDRYGRAQLLTRVTYAISPTLSLSARVNPTWTAEKVDTDTGVASVSVGHRTIISDRSFVKGDSHYIGTEEIGRAHV